MDCIYVFILNCLILDFLQFQMKWLGAGNVPVSGASNSVLNSSGSHLQVSNFIDIYNLGCCLVCDVSANVFYQSAVSD